MTIKINQKVSIAITDAYPVIINALLETISKLDHFEVRFHATNGEELLKKLRSNGETVDILLTDFYFSQGGNDDGFRLIKKIHDSGYVRDIIIFTDVQNTLTLQHLLEQQVTAVISKRDDLYSELQVVMKQNSVMRRLKKVCHLSPTIQRIYNKLSNNIFSPSLTPRELEVIKLYAEGMRLKEIASQLKRSEGTIAVHKYNAMQKMNINNNAQLIDYVRQSGIRFGFA